MNLRVRPSVNKKARKLFSVSKMQQLKNPLKFSCYLSETAPGNNLFYVGLVERQISAELLIKLSNANSSPGAPAVVL